MRTVRLYNRLLLTISLADFPTMIAVEQLFSIDSIMRMFPNESDRNFDNFKQTLASVIIYYDELKETITTQDAKIAIVDLIANIGGILGLFLGMSFLSFVEFFEILFQIIIISYKKRTQVKSKKNIVSTINAKI